MTDTPDRAPPPAAAVIDAAPGRVPPGAPARGVAFFDFDATLTQRDTLIRWLVALRGRRRVLRALTLASMGSLRRYRVKGPLADQRTRFKESLFRRLLKDVPVEAAEAAADRMRPQLRWREDIVARFRQHRAEGDWLVIATGSPRLVVARLAAEVCPPDALIATELEETPDGRLTGRLVGANCVREDKARRVEGWLTAHAPVGRSYGYGNEPHDLPMLALVDQSRVVV
jgi:HAD superfamily hydrolase (TIGR01490 family)